MRVFFFALMIALLPLRGWLGDAMAMNMAVAPLQNKVQSVDAIKNVAAAANLTGAGDGFSAENATAQGPQANADADAHAASHCAGQAGEAGVADDTDQHCPPSCGACAACHSAALTSPGSLLKTPPAPAAAPPLTINGFASADSALRQKPPIS